MIPTSIIFCLTSLRQMGSAICTGAKSTIDAREVIPLNFESPHVTCGDPWLQLLFSNQEKTSTYSFAVFEA